MATTTLAPARPGPVTFVGIVLYIKAALAVAVGLALIFERDNGQLQSVTGQGRDFLVGTAVGELFAALVLFLVGAAVMSGGKWARLLVAIVVGLRLASAVYWMVSHTGGGLQWNALILTGLGVFVLWALYGNEESAAYFEGNL
jgi:hypothetical protein